MVYGARMYDCMNIHIYVSMYEVSMHLYVCMFVCVFRVMQASDNARLVLQAATALRDLGEGACATDHLQTCVSRQLSLALGQAQESERASPEAVGTQERGEERERQKSDQRQTDRERRMAPADHMQTGAQDASCVC